MSEDVRTFVEGTGAAGPIVFVALYVVLTVGLVPGTIPSLAAGALFGAAWGSVLVVFGATAGAVAAFEIARRAGRERVARRLGPRLAAADGWIGRQGLLGVVGLRLVPVVPFNALNYAFGLSSVGRRDHALGTLVGIVPGSVAFVALGDAITDPTSSGFLLSLGALALLSVVGVVRARRAPATARR